MCGYCHSPDHNDEPCIQREIDADIFEKAGNEIYPKEESLRKIFNLPARYTTLEFYPTRISLDTFQKIIKDGIDGFVNNMRHLKEFGPNYVEEWSESFLAWLEIEEER